MKWQTGLPNYSLIIVSDTAIWYIALCGDLFYFNWNILLQHLIEIYLFHFCPRPEIDIIDRVHFDNRYRFSRAIGSGTWKAENHKRTVSTSRWHRARQLASLRWLAIGMLGFIDLRWISVSRGSTLILSYIGLDIYSRHMGSISYPRIKTYILSTTVISYIYVWVFVLDRLVIPV